VSDSGWFFLLIAGPSVVAGFFVLLAWAYSRFSSWKTSRKLLMLATGEQKEEEQKK